MVQRRTTKKLLIGLLLIGAGIIASLTFKTDQPIIRQRVVLPIPAGKVKADVAAVKQPTKQKTIHGLTVNHHLLADDLVAQMITIAAAEHPKRIILLSPNHFSRGRGFIITSNQDWLTDNGLVKEDHELVRRLTTSGPTRLDETPFQLEHGIYNILPFIAQAMPGIPVVPIIFKEGAPDSTIDAFANQLHGLIDKKTLIIASLDFSHYKTSAIAYEHDAVTIAALKTFNYAALPNLDIDSTTGLRAFLKLMQFDHATKMDIVAHKNSADILGQPDLPETTSYIDATFAKPNGT